ncbi:hypothetical protein ACC685_36410, partial [Rhizobium ruizarguesonis]
MRKALVVWGGYANHANNLCFLLIRHKLHGADRTRSSVASAFEVLSVDADRSSFFLLTCISSRFLPSLNE